MKEIESWIKERIGRDPDARVLDSVWTEKGWERAMKMYFVSPSRREIDALRTLTESLDEPSMDVNKTAENDSSKVALLSYPGPSTSLLL